MKENSIEELKQKLEELYKTQQARLDVGADDLDIREEIAEVEEQIKELQDETSDEADIKEDIKILEKFKNNEMQRDKLERDIRCGGWKIGDIYKCLELDNAIEHILSDYKRVLKENEELKEKKKNIEPVLIGNKMYFIDKGLYEDLLNDIKNNYIPIQKLKEKIEELDIEISTCEYADDDSEEYKQEIEKNKAELLIARKVLQQLLEESEEKE